MAVSAAYLTKMRTAIRRYSAMSADLTAELTDVVEECRADLVRLGLPDAAVTVETDMNILDAVKRYVRWAFEPAESATKESLFETYRLKADELRRMDWT